MNITRNNYETFFLLYADGELDPTTMQEVEKFVAVHPDLSEELEMLMDTVLADENITMPGKESLLKPELWNEETISPRQEAMMLLLDNELEESEAKKLVAEISADSSLQKDWNLLQQTTLVAASVEMPGKESLYRHESDRKPIPIRSIGWVKWVAAAAVIAGLGWFGLNRMDSDSNNPGVAVNATPVSKTPAIVTQPAGKANDISAEKTTGREEVPTTTTSKNNQTPVETAQTKKAVQQKVKEVKQQQDQPVEYAANNQQKLVEVVPETSIPSNTVATVNPNEINNPILKTIQNTETTPAIAQQAVYNEDDVNDDTEYVNIAGAKIKKQKLRGVFRNVTRTIGRTFDKSNVAQADVASIR
jgi:hypothetical protein